MATASPAPRGRVFIAKESFAYVTADGHPEVVKTGQRFREGHPLIEGRETLFKVDTSVIEVPVKE